MKDSIDEVRVLIAEWFLYLARAVVPEKSREGVAIAKALDQYVDATTPELSW